MAGLQPAKNAGQISGLGKRIPVSGRLFGVILIFISSLFFMLIQGGQLAAMIFIIVTSVCLYLVISRWSGISRAGIVRTFPGSGHHALMEAGTPLRVSLQVQLPGYWPLPYLNVKERLVRRDGREETVETLLVPGWKRRAELTYRTAPLGRGFYSFADTECTTGDIFGLFQQRRRFGLTDTVAVLPQKVFIREWKQLTRMFQGGRHSSATARYPRETMQPNGVREFVSGDRLSRIHWNATAKTGDWKTREFEREAVPRVMIILDREKQAYPSREHVELAVSTAISLADYTIGQGLAVGLLSAGKTSTYVEPKPGSAHLKGIANHLIDVEPDSGLPLMEVLREWAKVLVPGLFLIIVSPQSGAAMTRPLAWIKQRGINGCHMWIAPGTDLSEREQWSGPLGAAGAWGYAIPSLDELALELEDRMK